MKKLTFIFITMLFAAVSVLSAASYASPSEVSTVDAVRFNKNNHRYETLCSVHYYMRGDTVFTDKQYSFLGVQFSDNTTKGIVQEKVPGFLPGPFSFVQRVIPRQWWKHREFALPERPEEP